MLVTTALLSLFGTNRYHPSELLIALGFLFRLTVATILATWSSY